MMKSFSFKLYSLRGVVGVFVLWGLLQSMVRLVSGVRLDGDDAKENIFTQNWQLGYNPDNPPLYEWLLHATQLVFQPTLYSFFVLKYGLLTLTGLFTFLTARRVMGDEKWAALSAFSLVLLYQVGWNYFQALSHSALALTLVSASCYLVARLIEEQKLSTYLWLGLVMGLGLLSKYNYAGLMVAMIGAGVWLRTTRPVFLNGRLLLSLAITAMLVIPHAIWVFEHAAASKEMVADALGLGQASYLARVGAGLLSALVAILSFFLPFGLVALIWFRKAFRPNHKKTAKGEAVLTSYFGRAGLVGAGLIFVGVVLLGVSDVSERYAIPFLFPSWFWLMAILHERKKEAGALILGRAALVMAVFVIGMKLMIGFVAGPPFCDKCMAYVPYEVVADEIAPRLDGPVTLFVNEENSAGNLRRLFPKAEIVWLNLSPVYHPVSASRRCLMIWSEDMSGGPTPPFILSETNSSNSVEIVGHWNHPYKEKWHKTRWRITEVPEDGNVYKIFCAARNKNKPET